MPDPSNYDNEDDWMAACVPAVLDEGKPQDQAVAQCLNMWRDRNKQMTPMADEDRADFMERCQGQGHTAAECAVMWDDHMGGKAAGGIQRRSIPKVARAYSRLEIKEISEDKRTISGMATTPSVDRIGDVVEPLGARFAVPLPLLLDHDHHSQVGHVEFAKPHKNGIPFKARIVKFDEPGQVKDLVDKAWHLVKAKLRSFVSIGFRPFEDAVEFMDNGGLRYKEWEFLELSLVSIPANLEAVIYEAKSLEDQIRQVRDLGAASGPSTSRPGVAGKSRSNPVKLKERAAMSTETVAERISALEAKRAANLARMNALSEEAGKKGETLAEDAADEYDGLEREIETIDKQLERERKLEKFNLTNAKAVTPAETKTLADGAAARGGYVRVKAPELPKGIRLARAVKCLGMAEGNKAVAAQIAERLYGDDQGLVNVMKAAVMAGTVTDASWAGNLVGDETSVFADFAEFLRPMTIVGKFGTGGVPGLRRVPFRTALLGQSTGGAGYWVGEGQAKGVTSFDFTRTTLEPLKVANIAVVTEELLRDSSPSAEVLIRDGLAAALRALIDTDFISPTKTQVAGISPASITSAATPIASSGVTGDAVRADVAAIMQPFIDADNPPTTGVWVMAASTALSLSLMRTALGTAEFPDVTMNGGTFAGLPVIVSEYVPTSGGSPNTRYVFLVNASDVYFADDGGIAIDMSREASVQMDSAPTNAVVGPGGSPLGTAVATTLVSLWQTNCVGFRAERTLNWKLRRSTAVQALSGVVWGT